MEIIAIAVNSAVLTGTRTERFFRSSEFQLWRDDKGFFWCRDPKSELDILIPENNIAYVQVKREVTEEKVSRKRNA